MATYDDVKDIFVQICGLEEGDIAPETNMVSDVTIDSIDFMDATYEIDQKFGIKLPFEAWAADVSDGKPGATDQFELRRICEEVDRLKQLAAA